MREFRWEEYTLDVSIYESIRRFNRNSPLIENLSRIFVQLSETFQQVYNFSQCFHFFINLSLPEADVLLLKQGKYKRVSFKDHPVTYQELLKVTGRQDWMIGETDSPTIQELSLESLQRIFQALELGIPDELGGKLITFDGGKLNLGLFVLWGKGNENRKTERADLDKMSGEIAALYKNYCEFLNKEYQLITDNIDSDGILICKKTYLPSYNAVRWAKAAILYADMHNFTPFTEILRNIDTFSHRGGASIQKILNAYFEAMAGITQQGHGRIDRFFGSGILAVFGEHEDNSVQAACSAVRVAQNMSRKFLDLRKDIYRIGFGDEYKYEYNESIDVQLGIGIDYGTILFDYLGDERHREYTVAGDHVNFARMLGYEANRYDVRLGYQRPQILVSSTIRYCIEQQLIRKDLKKLEIQSQDRNYPYSVFGIDDEVYFTSNAKNKPPSGDLPAD